MKKVMVGIIGCGTIANSAHIPAYLKNEDVEIKHFCDSGARKGSSRKIWLRHCSGGLS